MPYADTGLPPLVVHIDHHATYHDRSHLPVKTQTQLDNANCVDSIRFTRILRPKEYDLPVWPGEVDQENQDNIDRANDSALANHT